MSEPENAEIGEICPGPPVPEGWPSCRVCGCGEYNACPDEDFGGCWRAGGLAGWPFFSLSRSLVMQFSRWPHHVVRRGV